MKKYDILVVGELNVDLILNRLNQFPVVGEEILAKEMAFTLGSSSAIFASNVSVLGNQVAFVGKIGNDLFGDFIMNCLERKNVYTHHIIRDKNFATGATVAFNVEEDRAAVTYPGAMAELTLADIPLNLLQESRHLHLSSIFLQPGIREDVPNLFKHARKMGLTTSFDPQWDPQNQWNLELNTILPHVDIFLPNETELLKLTRQVQFEDALEVLQRYDCISVIKQGKKGATVCHQGNLVFQDSYLNENVIDTIGAGDSFAAGFIHEYLKDSPLKVCQKIANLMGAISTTAPGGTTAFENSERLSYLALTKFGYRYDT